MLLDLTEDLPFLQSVISWNTTQDSHVQSDPVQQRRENRSEVVLNGSRLIPRWVAKIDHPALGMSL